MKFERPRSGTLLLCILGAALTVRIATAVLFHPPLFSDDLDYVALGKSLAHGDGYQLEGHPTAYRTPGYPLLLALSFRLFGESLVPIRAAQAAADLISCFLVFTLGRKLFSERVGLIGAGIFALFPIQILYVSIIMTETVFTTLLLLYLLLCTGDAASWKRSIAAGIVLGAGTLVRPTILLLPAAVFAVRWMSGWKPAENLKSLGITAGAALLILSPWLMRNFTEFGRITLTSNTGVNFWIGTHSGASGSYSFPENSPLLAVKDEFARSDMGIRLGLEFIRAHPPEYGMILVKKWAHFFSVDYWLLLSMRYQPDFRSAPNAGTVFSRFSLADVLAIHAPFAAVLLLATFGLCFRPGDEGKGLFFLFAPCAYWLLVHLAFFGSARYRFPVVPLFMIGGAYGADILLRKAYIRTRLRDAVFCFFALLFAAGWTAERVVIRRQAGEPGAQSRGHDPESTRRATSWDEGIPPGNGMPGAAVRAGGEILRITCEPGGGITLEGDG
jgi:4-amino-4-deoxy-L-arabinose transferase-like glycosyltransferase